MRVWRCRAKNGKIYDANTDSGFAYFEMLDHVRAFPLAHYPELNPEHADFVGTVISGPEGKS
ncbi:MAG: hypothetical protein E6Q97_37410 [Desulfurellales bacterium]|nr:MAG: hypothetical protein E6Q97_37410 [Desulfurellales bacterium]